MKSVQTFVALLLATTVSADYYKCKTGHTTGTKSGKCFAYQDGTTNIIPSATERLCRD
ncbi:hypothetical protein EG327_004828, partial [Venturia inaequalis]